MNTQIPMALSEIQKRACSKPFLLEHYENKTIETTKVLKSSSHITEPIRSLNNEMYPVLKETGIEDVSHILTSSSYVFENIKSLNNEMYPVVPERGQTENISIKLNSSSYVFEPLLSLNNEMYPVVPEKGETDTVKNVLSNSAYIFEDIQSLNNEMHPVVPEKGQTEELNIKLNSSAFIIEDVFRNVSRIDNVKWLEVNQDTYGAINKAPLVFSSPIIEYDKIPILWGDKVSKELPNNTSNNDFEIGIQKVVWGSGSVMVKLGWREMLNSAGKVYTRTPLLTVGTTDLESVTGIDLIELKVMDRLDTVLSQTQISVFTTEQVGEEEKVRFRMPELTTIPTDGVQVSARIRANNKWTDWTASFILNMEDSPITDFFNTEGLLVITNADALQKMVQHVRAWRGYGTTTINHPVTAGSVKKLDPIQELRTYIEEGYSVTNRTVAWSEPLVRGETVRKKQHWTELLTSTKDM